MQSASHVLRDHTGELELEIEAPSLGELYAEAARALARIIAGEWDDALADRDDETVMVRASGPEALLVEWLNELIFRSEVHHRAYTHVRIESIDSHGLTATMRGFPIEQLHTAVKAATMHRVKVDKDASGYRATVVLDV